MNRTPEQWERVNPEAFRSGSIQQAVNVIAMMREDLLSQSRYIQHLADALGTAEAGDALIEVARNAHAAEIELAAKELSAEILAADQEE